MFVCVWMGVWVGVWVFVICGCFDIFVGVLLICVLVFTVFCIVPFIYIYSYFLPMYGLLPPSDNSIAVKNNNYYYYFLLRKYVSNIS